LKGRVRDSVGLGGVRFRVWGVSVRVRVRVRIRVRGLLLRLGLGVSVSVRVSLMARVRSGSLLGLWGLGKG